ncbi:MAG: hypothetical protein ACLUAG_13730, partial [Lachnospiraceae bacterium]
HTLSITDVSLICWFHLKMFTALFLISEGTADIKICGLPVGGTVEAKGGSAPYLQGISAVIRDSPLSISTNTFLFSLKHSSLCPSFAQCT